MQAERYIAAADIGTSKIALSVAKIEGDDVQLIYYKETRSEGVRYSSVFAPQRTATALKAAVTEAEEELKIRILQLVVGLPRYYVTQVAGSAGMKRSNPDSCITREEINNLKSMAIDSYTLDDEVKDEIYGAVAQSFSADTDITGASESDIIGVPGETLEGNFKIFIGAKRPVRNIDVMLNEMGVALARKVFSPNAAAQAVLTEAEKENGVALVEIGAGVTSVTIYRGRLLRHYSSIPFGGRSITNDIKSECGFTEALAENIKLAFGACLPDKLQNLSDKIIQINDNENGSYEQLSVKYLSQIITCRVREILEAVLYQIQQSGYADQLRNGVVITGGWAMLVNMCQMLKEMSGYTVRIGYPRTQVFSSGGCPGATEPSASASIGMILEARRDIHLNCIEESATALQEGQDGAGESQTPDDGPVIPDGKTEATLFKEEDIITPSGNKKNNDHGGKVTWFGKQKKKINDVFERAFDNTVGNLFDSME